MPDRSQLFADIDSMDPDAFVQHLDEDAVMRFGNADPVQGRAAIREVWAGFCAGIAGVSHELVERWEQGEATIVEAHVTYTRQDGSTVRVPVVTIYRAPGELIADYRVYIDLAPLAA